MRPVLRFIQTGKCSACVYWLKFGHQRIPVNKITIHFIKQNINLSCFIFGHNRIIMDLFLCDWHTFEDLHQNNIMTIGLRYIIGCWLVEMAISTNQQHCMKIRTLELQNVTMPALSNSCCHLTMLKWRLSISNTDIFQPNKTSRAWWDLLAYLSWSPS